MKSNPAIASFLLLCWVAGGGSAHAQRVLPKVTDAFGIAQKQTGDAKAPWRDISVGDLLPAQSSVKTGKNSAVLITLQGGHVLRIGSETTVQLREVGKDRSFSFEVLSGKIWSLVRSANKPAKYEVETPSVVAGVEGTLFAVIHDQASEESTVSTNQGTVNLRQGDKTVKVAEGLSSSVTRNQKTPLAAAPTPQNLQGMWQTIRKENWTRPGAGGAAASRLNRGEENRVDDLVGQLHQHKKEEPRKKQPKRKSVRR